MQMRTMYRRPSGEVVGLWMVVIPIIMSLFLRYHLYFDQKDQ